MRLNNTSLIAAIYARQSLSIADDINSGQSLSSESQINTCQEYCNRNGFNILMQLSLSSVDLDRSSFIDKDKRRRLQRTGKRDWQERPGLMRLYESAQRGEFKHLVVFDMGRLGGDATELHLIRESFDNLGVTIHLIGENIRTDQEAGGVMFSVFTGMAQKRVTDISRHAKKAALTRIKQAHIAAMAGTGLGKAHSRPPGWVEIKPTFAQTPDQVEVEVRERGPKGTRGWYRLKMPTANTYREMVLYRLQGLSYSQIAQKLNDIKQEGGIRLTSNGTRWNIDRVCFALNSDNILKYKGYSVWGKGLPLDDPNRIVTPGVFPLLFEGAEEAQAYGGAVGIIDALEAMQRALLPRSFATQKRNLSSCENMDGSQDTQTGRLLVKTTYILSGLLKCAICGGHMRACQSTSRAGGVTITAGEVNGVTDAGEGKVRYVQYACRFANTSGISHPSSQRVRYPNANGMYVSANQAHTAVIEGLKVLAQHTSGMDWERYYNAQQKALQSADRQAKAEKRDVMGDTVEGITKRIDALFEMRMNGEIEKQDYDRQYKKLADRRAELEKESTLIPDKAPIAHGLAALTKAFDKDAEAPTVAVIRSVLMQIAQYVELPITVEGLHRIQNKNALIEHVRIVLKEPLPDGTTSVISGMYKYNYIRQRHIVLE